MFPAGKFKIQGTGKSRFATVSVQNTDFTLVLLHINVLFSIQTILNILLPFPVYIMHKKAETKSCDDT